MPKLNSPTLVVAPSRTTRGGITAVIQAYEQTPLWCQWECVWIETHIDRSVILKFLFFLRAFFIFLLKLPAARLVHIHLSEPVGAARKAFFAAACFICRKPVILHLHAFSTKTTIEGRFAWLYRWLFVRARRIIVLTPYWSEAVLRFVPNAQVVVLYNPCPRSQLVSDSILRNHTILFAGTLSQRKGYHDLIRAFSQAGLGKKGWRLVMLGNGEIREATALADALGVGGDVDFPGWVSGTEKKSLFESAGIFCLPSYAEGLPMAILDAFSYALPVVATPVGGIPDVIVNGKDGLLVDCGDVDSLSRVLMELTMDDELRRRLSNRSLELAESTFSIDTLSARLGEEYLAAIQ